MTEGARNLMRDVQQGKLSMVDATAFAPGRNLALSPGKVVLRIKLIELIQYEHKGRPKEDQVHQIPLLIIPPWINKFYIMDLQPKNSMVRFLTEQGFTVFMVSWRNPDSTMESTTIEDYLDYGPLAASDAVQEITGSPTVNVMDYCLGGTLLAMALAWLAARGDDRFAAATFMVSLQDFSKVGDTALFLGGSHVDFIEQQMMERGYLDSREMSNMFNLLRSNDLIWSNVANNYLLGQKPPAFDLLYWNSDGTRTARAAHSWYLRNTYVENNPIEPGKVQLKGEALDLGRVRLDVYAVGAEKDHIVPWDAAWRIRQLMGGKVRFVLASSGHVAGIINPPGGKGMYWTNDDPADTAQQWREAAQRHDGSWWMDWAAWLAARSGNKGKPPSLGSAAHPPLQDGERTIAQESGGAGGDRPAADGEDVADHARHAHAFSRIGRRRQRGRAPASVEGGPKPSFLIDHFGQGGRPGPPHTRSWPPGWVGLRSAAGGPFGKAFGAKAGRGGWAPPGAMPRAGRSSPCGRSSSCGLSSPCGFSAPFGASSCWTGLGAAGGLMAPLGAVTAGRFS